MAVSGATAQPGAAAEFKGRDIEAYKRMFMRSEEAHSEARDLAHRDRDWFDNFDDNQWSPQEKAVLKRREQPIGGSNRIKRKVQFLAGLEQQRRSDPKAFPRNEQNTEAAEVVTKVIDAIETETRFDAVASAAFKNLLVEAIEICEVIVEGEGQIVVNVIDFDSFFYDPRSKRRDFSDARYLGYQDWFDLEEALELFPDEAAQAIIRSGMDLAGLHYDYADKPQTMWADQQRQRVRIACMYWRGAGNVWNYVYFTGGGILREGVSLYRDERGQPDCAIIAGSCYVTRNNERYGVVRDMINSQREMNFRRSQSLVLLKNRRMWSRGEGMLPPTAREDVARPDGILIANGSLGEDWGFIESQSEIAGNFELLQEAKAEIDVLGPNAGLQGRGVENQSGRAIALQQNAGMAEENDVFDAHNDWKLRVYRAMWARAKQFWTAEKMIRVTDDDGAPRFIGINTPKPMMAQGANGMLMPVMGPNGQPMPQMDPTGQPVLENVLAEMDVDIILEAVPDAVTLQHDQFEQLAKLASAGVPIPPDVLIQASQIADKKIILERMKEEGGARAQLEKAAEQIQGMQKMIAQLQQQLQKAGEAAMQKPLSPLDMARAQQALAQAERIRAETVTMQPAETGMTPQDIADVEYRVAQTRKLQADTARTIQETIAPRAF